MKKFLKSTICCLFILAVGFSFYGCGQKNLKPLPDTEGKRYSAPEYDFYEHWVQVDETKNIYGNIYVPKDFDENKTYPAMIMSHGFTSSYAVFNTYIMSLVRAGFVCYAYDFCGGALTSKSDGDFYETSVMTEVRDLKCVIEDIGRQRYFKHGDIYLMGVSQGGLVTALTAPAVADKIEGIVLLYPGVSGPDRIRSLYENKESIPDYPSFLGVTVGRIYFEDIYDLNAYKECAKYKGKVLIYHGDKDGIVDISWSERALNYYKNAELVTVVGGTHRFENRLVVDICNDFINKIKRSQ